MFMQTKMTCDRDQAYYAIAGTKLPDLSLQVAGNFGCIFDTTSDLCGMIVVLGPNGEMGV